jgi:hypothetical protein
MRTGLTAIDDGARRSMAWPDLFQAGLDSGVATDAQSHAGTGETANRFGQFLTGKVPQRFLVEFKFLLIFHDDAPYRSRG